MPAMSFTALVSLDASYSDYHKREFVAADHNPLSLSTRSHYRIEARMSYDHPQGGPARRKSLFGLSPILSNDDYSSPFGGAQGGRRQPIILPLPSPSIQRHISHQNTLPHGGYSGYPLETISSSPTPYYELPHHQTQPNIMHPHSLTPEPATPPHTQQHRTGPASSLSSNAAVPGGDASVNVSNPRKCKQCGQPGRYVDGKCIEKWGKGPLGRGSVCDRCRKRNKRLEKLAELEKKNHENQRRLQLQADSAAST